MSADLIVVSAWTPCLALWLLLSWWLKRAADRVLVLRVVCSWCNGIEREGTPNAPTSHTICAPCYRNLMPEDSTSFTGETNDTQTS